MANENSLVTGNFLNCRREIHYFTTGSFILIMKKWILFFLVSIILLLAAVYVFIPNVVKLKATVAVTATRPGLHRMLLDKSTVAKWWPGKVSNDSFYLNDFLYTINNSNITVLPITIAGQKTTMTSSLFLVPIVTESTQLEWAGAMVTSYNPVQRVVAFLKAKKIEADMNTIIQKMQAFYSIPENIYGFDIKKELVTDSTLIQTSGICKGYPETPFIYHLIDKLQAYAISHAASESGYPMLNIRPLDSTDFEVKVAIPVTKLLPAAGDILQKRMPGMGNILVAEVKGGNSIGAKAFEQIKKYADDYQRLAPAIPFYSLVTDRMKEPDSTRWVTKIYFPVM